MSFRRNSVSEIVLCTIGASRDVKGAHDRKWSTSYKSKILSIGSSTKKTTKKVWSLCGQFTKNFPGQKSYVEGRIGEIGGQDQSLRKLVNLKSAKTPMRRSHKSIPVIFVYSHLYWDQWLVVTEDDATT